MKAAVLHQVGGPFQIEEVELLPPEPGEVRVRMGAAGTCHSDWHFVSGDLSRPLPVILGHEGAGIVEEVGAGVTSVQPGQRVIINWAPSCSTCFYCRHTNPTLCETFWPWRNGTMPDGSTRLRLNGEIVRQFSTQSTFAEKSHCSTGSPCSVRRRHSHGSRCPCRLRSNYRSGCCSQHCLTFAPGKAWQYMVVEGLV